MSSKKLLIVSLGGTGTPDENLVYDNTNIATQFPNGNNTGVDSTGNILTATDSNGTAISILRTQDVGGDWVALTSETIPFEADFKFANISSGDSTADLLVTPVPIVNGDDLVIVKTDNSINEVVASGVVGSTNPPTDVFGSTLDGSVNIDATASSLRSLCISSDGSKFYVGTSLDEVLQYVMTTPFSMLDGVAYAGKLSALTRPYSMLFSEDGSTFWYASTTSLYQITLTTPFDVTSTILTTANRVVSDFCTNFRGFVFNDDGTEITALGINFAKLYQIGLSTAYDLMSTLTPLGNVSITLGNTESGQPVYNKAGTRLYVFDTTTQTIKQFTLTTPFDVTGGVVDDGTLSLSGDDTAMKGLAVSAVGDKLYTCGDTSDFGYQYSINGNIDETAAYQLDTTATTAGEIPSKVYSVGAKAEFDFVDDTAGFQEAVILSNSYVYSAGDLTSTRTYDVLQSDGSQQIQTRVTLKAIGDELTTLQATINEGV